MLQRLFSREPAWEKAARAAASAGGLLHKSIDQGKADGLVSEAALPLFTCLSLGSVALFRELVSNEPFRDQLTKVGFGNSRAQVSGYLQLVAQRLWDLYLAFGRDPGITQALGGHFGDFLGTFLAVTDMPREMVADTLRSADRLFEKAGNRVDPRPVIDMQTLDFLQTITDGRYTPDHWRSAGVRLIPIQGEVLLMRLTMVKTAKEQMGLSRPVL